MVVEDARALLAAGPLCDACLGRPFADLSFGLTNAERGKALRVTVALADDEDYERVDPDDCWVCEGQCGRYDEWADRAVEAVGDLSLYSYQVGTRVPPLIEENDRLLREDAGMDPSAGEQFKSALNREVGKRFGARTDTPVDFERSDVQLLLHVERGDVEVQVNPAFVYGRYRKLERDVPQTEWPCRECGGSGKQLGDDGEEPCDHCEGTGYMYPTSVEQEVAPHVREAMDGEEATFHGAGREDVDALMLGTGRPFVAEVKQPRRRRPDVDALEERINRAADGRVEVEGLALATHELVERVKELDASKTYRATVEFDDTVDADAFQDALAELEGTTVEQYTPERVDHRRAGKTRTRTVYEMDGALEDETGATVEVHGEGGLYIKELIHGDDGRTDPSLAGLLGVPATVTALDVLSVEGEDEDFADDEYLIDRD
jgi:tRNA pseudouridine synthase 10